MWIDTDIAKPAYDKQIVKVKVADFSGDYITNAYYNHREGKWYNKDGNCLNDNVYKWKISLLKLGVFSSNRIAFHGRNNK